MSVLCICKQCGKEFTVTPSKFNDGRGKFCSRRCKDDSQKINIPTGLLHYSGPIYWNAKTCARCKRLLPFENFRKNKNMTDKKETWCKECQNNELKNYRLKHPDMAKAHSMLNAAVGTGKIKRSLVCQSKRCLEAFRGPVKTEGHHEDYSKPLEVIWLCRDCHIQLHKSKRKAAGL